MQIISIRFSDKNREEIKVGLCFYNIRRKEIRLIIYILFLFILIDEFESERLTTGFADETFCGELEHESKLNLDKAELNKENIGFCLRHREKTRERLK